MLRLRLSLSLSLTFCLRPQLLIFADDTMPRYLTATCMLDYETVATADKFGTVAVLRLPTAVSDAVDDDPTAHRVLYERGVLNGAAHKVFSDARSDGCM
jgi:splicing factor 3B subunit 3